MKSGGVDELDAGQVETYGPVEHLHDAVQPAEGGSVELTAHDDDFVIAEHHREKLVAHLSPFALQPQAETATQQRMVWQIVMAARRFTGEPWVFGRLNTPPSGVVVRCAHRLDPAASAAVMTRWLELQAGSGLDVTAARHRLRVELDRWECEQVDDGLLVFTELVANAVRHGGGATHIHVVHGEQTLRFEVHDRSHDVPAFRSPGGPSGGFGLRIVGNLTETWGWEQTAHGKVVWCEVPCCPVPHADGLGADGR